MSQWLLLENANKQGVTVQLVGHLTYGPPQSHFDVSLTPDNDDDLYRSAQVGGEEACRLLWREGYVRRSATARFSFDQLPPHILGHSGDLLFALVVITAAMPRPDGYPPLAATGVLADKGRVLEVEGVPAKLKAALEVLPTGGLLFFPRGNNAEVGADLIHAAQDRGIELQPIDRLDQAAARLGITIRKIYLDAPYRGLETFQYPHRAIYFGRQADIVSLRERLLSREANKTPGLLIVAASGAGKSSLVRAGLIPALEEGPLALQDRPIFWSAWRPSDTERGADQTALVKSILAAWLREPAAKIHLIGLTETVTLSELADQLGERLPPDRRFLWLVDQLEELFTPGFSDEVVDAFGAFLKRLQTLGVWVVATLRNDFYGRYQKSALLDCFGNYGLYDLRPLDAAALDQIIRGPAELADLDFEIDGTGVSLASRLREDMGGQTDALPLLEFTLMSLYTARDDKGKMTFRSYLETKGLFGAIGQRAETVFLHDLDQATRDTLPRLLWKMTTSSHQQWVTAHPVRLADFPEGDRIRDLIDVFTRERLLVQNQDRDKDHDPRFRVAHEALLTHWPRSEKIIDGFQRDKQLHDRLKDQAVRWRESKQDPSLLLHAGLPLQEGEGLLTRIGKRSSEMLDADVRALIHESSRVEQDRQRAEREREQAKRAREQAEMQARLEREQAERAREQAEMQARLEREQTEMMAQRRRTRIARAVAAAMTGLTAVTAGIGYWAWEAQQEAERNFTQARTTVDTFVTDIARKELADIPGLQALRQRFAERAVAQYRDFTERRPGDAQVRMGYARAKGALGTILGGIGSFDRAVSEMQVAITLLQQSVDARPDQWQFRLALGKQRLDLGNLYMSVERFRESLPYANQAFEELDKLLSQQPDNPEVIHALARAYNLRGNL